MINSGLCDRCVSTPVYLQRDPRLPPVGYTQHRGGREGAAELAKLGLRLASCLCVPSPPPPPSPLPFIPCWLFLCAAFYGDWQCQRPLLFSRATPPPFSSSPHLTGIYSHAESTDSRHPVSHAMRDINVQISNGTCYYDSGRKSSANIMPCGNAAYSVYACCQQGDVCLDQSTCYYPDRKSDRSLFSSRRTGD